MSLLEICIGVAILSIVVFFAAPSLVRARDDYELDQTTRQVAGQMEWTRLKAITRDQDCRFRLTSNASYVIECKGFAWLPDETVTLPSGFQITATATPQFHKRGNAAPAATITVWDRRLNSKNVVVNITGRVRVE
jgi:type II secretory pathway pseudopilin PulG